VEQCIQGKCQGMPQPLGSLCDDGDECTTDACDPATGNVSHTPLPSCKPCMVAANCNDNNPCTTESCQAGKCAYANAASGTPCNDGIFCTKDDSCFHGMCQGNWQPGCNGP